MCDVVHQRLSLTNNIAVLGLIPTCLSPQEEIVSVDPQDVVCNRGG